MSKKIKLSILSIISIVILACFTLIVSAISTSGIIASATLKTGQDTNFSQITMTSSYDVPSSGDVGGYFYKTSVGMPESFVQSTNRRGNFTLIEKDTIFSANDIAAYYTGYFSINSSGLYRMNSYSRIDLTAPIDIDDTNTVELFLQVNIDAINGDSSNNVPSGLFNYQFWIQ